MKIKNNVVWFNIDEDNEKIVKSLMDDGDWEYDRVGFGIDEGKLFMVDMDDSGEIYRGVNYVKEGLELEDVLEEGVKCGVMVKIDDGYDEDDVYRWSMECGEKEMEEFCKKVLKSGKWNDEIYS